MLREMSDQTYNIEDPVGHCGVKSDAAGDEIHRIITESIEEIYQLTQQRDPE
jgi:hypothetical protein